MKTLTRSVPAAVMAAVLSLLLLVGVPLQAQQFTLSNTTLNGAITATATTLVLTSASASTGSSFGAPAAGQCLWVDGELMRIVSIASTTATVSRANSGGGGLPATSHKTLAVIFTGSCSAFQAAEPNVGDNAVCTAQPAPWINIKTGNVWWCRTSDNTWSGFNFRKFTFNSVPQAQ